MKVLRVIRAEFTASETFISIENELPFPCLDLWSADRDSKEDRLRSANTFSRYIVGYDDLDDLWRLAR